MIKTENVNYIYRRGIKNHRQALYDINLEIPDGSLTAIIGHTGSGKSTLIQLFNALEKPTSGKIIIDGVDITAPKADLKLIRRKVGVVFQYPEHQLFEESVYKDIAFGPKNIGMTADEIDTRVRECAELVGLKEKELSKSPFELSGGQKRRAAIAGVLAMNPDVLILDEPAAGLDPSGRNGIFELIKKLHKEKKEMIIIFVSHSMEDVAETAEHIIVMNNGRIENEGDREKIFSEPERLRSIGLEVPQITLLAEKLRNAGYNIPKNIYTPSDAEKAILSYIGGDCGV